VFQTRFTDYSAATASRRRCTNSLVRDIDYLPESTTEFAGIFKFGIVVWHLGSVIVLSAIAGAAGQYFFNWSSLIKKSKIVM